MDKMMKDNAFFWQFFATGAPCNLSHNINSEMALVNGAPATLHSLSFSTPEELMQVRSQT
jgi:hypothetical protein